MNLLYVYLAYICSWPGAPIIGFAAVSMTLSKTVLYWAQEYFCGGCAVGHNDLSTLIIYWVIPNGWVSIFVLILCLNLNLMADRLWLIFPTLIVIQLGKDIATSLRVANTAEKVKKSK